MIYLGEEIDVRVQLTANHRGFFEFKLCRNNNPRRAPRQSCFDRSDSIFMIELCQIEIMYNSSFQKAIK